MLRTLRFWKLSTDYSRFMSIEKTDDDSPSQGRDEDEVVYEDLGGGESIAS